MTGQEWIFSRIWWSCDRLTSFQKLINLRLQVITEIHVPLDPRVTLLLDFEYCKISIHKRSFSKHANGRYLIESKEAEVR